MEMQWPVPLYRSEGDGQVSVQYAHNKKELDRKTLPLDVGGPDSGFQTTPMRAEWPKLMYHPTRANIKVMSEGEMHKQEFVGYSLNPTPGVHCNIDVSAKPAEVNTFDPKGAAEVADLKSQVQTLAKLVESMAGPKAPRRGRPARKPARVAEAEQSS